MPSVKKNKSVAFVIPYPPDSAPGQRFRFEQYLKFLNERNIVYTLYPFLPATAYSKLYKKRYILLHTLIFLKGYFLRLALLLKIAKYDWVFIFREATPAGPPFFEFLVSRLLRKQIIYDFDDAIWLEDPNEKGTLLARIKWKKKVSSICKWSYRISAGNEYLADYARQFNSNVIVIPTTIDTEHYHNPNLYKTNPLKKITIGWTGTHSTLQYLNPLIPVLEKLEAEHDFEFLVIANKNPKFLLRSFTFLPWSGETEIEDLMKIDIGLMPLTDDCWSKGKCGFKLLQYLALEIPAIASPVGVNKKIITEKENGFLCQTPESFYEKIQSLIDDSQLRRALGKNGRQLVERSYSVEANKGTFLSLFE